MHPNWKSTIGLFVAAVALFLVSASGQSGTYWENGPHWLGAIGWFGFLISVLLLVVSGVIAIVSRVRHRHQPV